MVPDFFRQCNKDRLCGIVPVLYILFMMDSTLLIPVSSSASIISTGMLSGPVAFPCFMLFKARLISSFKIGGPHFFIDFWSFSSIVFKNLTNVLFPSTKSIFFSHYYSFFWISNIHLMNSMFFLLVPLLWCVLLMDFYKALSQFHPTVCSTPLLDPLYISVLLRCLAPCILIHLSFCLPSLLHHVQNMISHPYLFLT